MFLFLAMASISFLGETEDTGSRTEVVGLFVKRNRKKRAGRSYDDVVDDDDVKGRMEGANVGTFPPPGTGRHGMTGYPALEEGTNTTGKVDYWQLPLSLPNLELFHASKERRVVR